jgi:hypothetical protein
MFWEHGLNRTDTSTVKTALLFCSLETIYRILLKCGLITATARICVPNGGLTIVNLPIGAPPSMCIAAGPYASRALHWGTVTKQEYDAIHRAAAGLEGSASAAGDDGDVGSDAGAHEKRARLEAQ